MTALPTPYRPGPDLDALLDALLDQTTIPGQHRPLDNADLTTLLRLVAITHEGSDRFVSATGLVEVATLLHGVAIRLHPSKQFAQECTELASRAQRLHLADGRSDAGLGHWDCRIRPHWAHDLWHQLTRSLQMHTLGLVAVLGRDVAFTTEIG
jgi:hypothetical protein